MIHQPLKNKKGGTKGAVEYLLNEREQEGTARVLRGDSELTKEIIKSLEHRKQRATVGVLSFEEINIPEDVKFKIIDDFEKTLLPGMQGRYNILWVEHTDKGRLELNYVIPKVDLLTQKSLNPYYDRADRSRIEIFRDKINLEHNLSSPNDPAKAQTLNNDKRINLLKDYKELDIVLHDLVASKAIQSREQLIQTVKDNGMLVTRTAKDSISIKLPEAKVAKKFKGGIYNEQFTSIRELETSTERTRETIQHQASRATHLEIHRLEQKLESYTERKSEELKREFARAEQKLTRRIAERDIETSELEQIANFNSHNSVNSNNINREYRINNELNHLESTERISRDWNGRGQVHQDTNITADEFTRQRHSEISENKGEQVNDITRDNATRRTSQRKSTQQAAAEKLRAELKLNNERIQRELKLSQEQLREELNADDGELYKQARKAMLRIREHRTIEERLRKAIDRFGEKLRSFKQSINELFEGRRFLEKAIEQGETKEEAKYLSEYVKDAHKIIKNQDDLDFAYEMRKFHIKVDKESLKEYKDLAIRTLELSEKEGFDYDVVLKAVIKQKYYSHEQSRDQGMSM